MPQQSFGKNICHRKKRKIAFIITKKKVNATKCKQIFNGNSSLSGFHLLGYFLCITVIFFREKIVDCFTRYIFFTPVIHIYLWPSNKGS